MDQQLQLSTASAFLFKTSSFGCLLFTNSIKIHWVPGRLFTDQSSGNGDNLDSWEKLFAPIHSLYVVEIVVLQLFPLQLECICDKTRLRGPRLWAQDHLHWYLKSLEFNCMDEVKSKRQTQDSTINNVFLFH